MSASTPARTTASTRRPLAFAMLFTVLALANSWAFARVAGSPEGLVAAAWIDFALGALMAAAASWFWRAWWLARRGPRATPAG